jgi:GT2 family glycosyltransferase
MHGSMPRVSAAVLNFNGRDLLDVIVPSLLAQTYRDFEPILVDDGSTDDSVAYVRERWPEVRVVPAGEANVGVAAAFNAAVRASTGELVALLNNDLELDPRWLEELVAGLDRHPEAATASGKLLSYHRRDVIDSTGDLFMRSGMAFGRGSGEVDRGQYDGEQEVFAPTAGAGLYRKRALADVGEFDESLYAYLEDVDWGLRAQLAGYRSRYVPAAVAFHMGSRTTGGDTNPVYFRLKRRNTIALLLKDVPLRFALRNLHVIAGNHLLGLAYSARAGMLWPHLRAWGEAVWAAPGWLRARRRILGEARIPLRDFGRFVSDRR